jgi:6-phosphogluconolactonase
MNGNGASVLRVFDDLDALTGQAAEAAAAIIGECVQRNSRCALALSGGHTPRPLYALLASRFRDRIPWAQVHVFWGDERFVPATHPDSNYRMATATLLDHVPCPTENIHPMPTHAKSPEAAAQDYEQTLRNFSAGDWPHLDLNILGLGADGHTASVFPGSPALEEQVRWVAAVQAPADPPTRLTLTLPALVRAGHIHVLVTGAAKAQALRDVLSGAADPRIHPAAGLLAASGELTWWVDRDAAGLL